MQTIGRFEIIDVVGRGRSGVVYRARDPELDRELAIKVVTHDRIEGARAMAKLHHPSVMPVFDVGEVEDGVYVVMPLMTGGTLLDWLNAEPRPWRAVLERFQAAGRGLAAAHAVGWTHGDFDPRNVLLGRGREVRVTDFAFAPGSAGADAARDDQQRFCQSLREALHGRGAPAWLSAAVTRGASPAREQRWPSMNALLGHIERRLRRPRRLALGAGALTIAGVAAGLALLVPADDARRPPPCPDPVEQVNAIWGPAARARVEQAFAASGSPVAADTLQRVLPALDRYAAQWRSAHVASCRATHVARTQSAELLDKRSVCLDRRLAVLRSWAESLASADKELVQKAITLPNQLPRIADCENDALLGQQALPTDPALRAKIAALETRVDEQEALLTRGDPPKVVEASRALVAEARTIDYLPLQARALYLHVRALGVARADLEAEVRELAALATRAKDDVIAGYAWGRLVQELVQKGRMDEARQLIPAGEAAVLRADSQPQIAFQLYMTLGGHAGNTGDLEGATANFEKAMKIADTSQRTDLRVGALRYLSYSLYVRGRRDEARPMMDEAVTLARELFGPDHPRYADFLDYQASILASGDAEDKARGTAAIAEAMRIRIATYGEQHPAVAENLATLALHAYNREDLDEAEAYIDRALAVMEKVPVPLALPGALATKADVVLARRDLAAARPHYERALKAAIEATGEKSLDYVSLELAYAESLIDHGECPRGRELAGHALRVTEASRAPMRNGALRQLARCDRMAGKHDAAIARLEEAVRFCASTSCSPTGAASNLRDLGRALVETGRDRERGYALVHEALDRYRKLGKHSNVEGSEEWLKQHPP